MKGCLTKYSMAKKEEKNPLFNDPSEVLKAKVLLKPLSSAEELRDWLDTYLGLRFPMGTVYPTSTHGPVDAMWRIYELFKTGESQEIPWVVMLASRDSFKTLSAAALEVLCMLHFEFSVAHASAVLAQAEKAVQYVNSFFDKLNPYLEYNGWKQTSENTRKIEWRTSKKDKIYLRILTASKKGFNSEHLPMLCIDEIELIQDPGALEEASMVPAVYNNYFPLTIYLSTRKWAGGLMELKLKEVEQAGGEILRWNIIDVCERITIEQAEGNKPKIPRYISVDLPMSNISPEEFKKLPNERKNDYEKIMAYAGIAEHPFLPVMKNMLVDRPQDDYGGLFKPLVAVRNNFRVTSPQMANAQLLCDKPSSEGLVYGRFNEENILTPKQAYEKISGEEMPTESFEYFKQYIKDLGFTFIGGADWGFTDHTSLVVLAVAPNGDVYIVDNIHDKGWELDDIVKYCKELAEEWPIEKWYVDQAYPAYIKTLRKDFNVPKFTKVVEDGITALQGKIVNSNNERKFFVIKHSRTDRLSECFGEYSWAKDAKGNIIEGRPYHDKEGVSDIMDSLRYPMQCLFSKGRKPIVTHTDSSTKGKTNIEKDDDLKTASKKANDYMMKNAIQSRATQDDGLKDKNKNKNKKIKLFWS